jgi:hypothetical protein
METTIDVIGCKDKDKVRFAAKSFKGEAYIWWKTILATLGREKATGMDWRKFRKVFLKKYVSNHEVEQLEDEYLHLKMEGTDYRKYTSRFLEIIELILDFAGLESKRTGRFIWGAHPKVQANMSTTKPRTIQKSTELLAELTEELIWIEGNKGNDSGFKRKFDGISLERRGTGSAKEEEVTLPVVIKHGELMMATRLHVSTVTKYILGNVNMSLMISVAERGMPRVIVISRLPTVPPLPRKEKEQVPPRTTPVCS